MKQWFKYVVVLAVVMFIAGVQEVLSQTSFSAELSATNNGNETRRVTFGYAKNATYCIDADTSLHEQELPPPPPSDVIDVRFLNHRAGAPSTCMGEGLAVNYHFWDSAPVTDTFQLKLQSGSGGFPMVLRWPAGLNANYSTLSLHDIISGTLINVDMLANTEATIANSAFDRLYIIANPMVNGVVKDVNVLPEKFALGNNYPNPFNPVTSIKFSIEKTSVATMAVYDILGRKVSTLVSEELTPGYYTATWNGTDEKGFSIGTGIYYVRMNAVPVNGDQAFSDVKKIMLMK